MESDGLTWPGREMKVRVGVSPGVKRGEQTIKKKTWAMEDQVACRSQSRRWGGNLIWSDVEGPGAARGR